MFVKRLFPAKLLHVVRCECGMALIPRRIHADGLLEGCDGFVLPSKPVQPITLGFIQLGLFGIGGNGSVEYCDSLFVFAQHAMHVAE